MHYPCNYGYIPQTLSDDGDPVDVLVITPVPLIPGVVVTCRPLGVLQMEDEAGGDNKLLAVPIDKILSIYTPVAEARGPEPAAPEDDPALLRALQGSRARQVGQGRGAGKARTARVPRSATACASYAAKKAAATGLRQRAMALSADVRSLERAALAQLVEVALDACALARQEVVDRVARTAGCAEPVRRSGLHRQQAARHLVLALGAAFEARDSRVRCTSSSGW